MKIELLVNINSELSTTLKSQSILKKIESELEKCTQSEGSKVFLAISYIKKSGIEYFKQYFEEILRNKGSIRIITCLDFGLTDPEVLSYLFDLSNSQDIESRIFHNEFGNYHPKIYLFEHNNGSSQIIGSNNLSKSAFTNNIECATYSNDKALFEELKSYFDYIWQDSLQYDNEMLESYSVIRNQDIIQKRNLEISIDRLLEQQKINLDKDTENQTSNLMSKIAAFRKRFELPNKILYWRDITFDDIIAVLKESYKLPGKSQQELIISMINSEMLSYKSSKAIGSWLNMIKFCQSLNIWNKSELTQWGEIALSKYKISSLSLLQFLDYSILVNGNLFILCKAITEANQKISKKIPTNRKFLKSDWLDLILPLVNEFLAKYELEPVVKGTLNRYIPTLFNKYGLSRYLIKTDKKAIYSFKLYELSKFICEYGLEFNF